MSRKKLPKSLRKFIRQEKARIRREFLSRQAGDAEGIKEEIRKLYEKLGILKR